MQMHPNSATLWLTGGFECGNASLVASTNAINLKPERDKSISLFVAFYSCILSYCVCKAPIKARPQTPRDAEEELHDDLGVVATMVLSKTSPAHANNHPRRFDGTATHFDILREPEGSWSIRETHHIESRIVRDGKSGPPL